MWTVTIYFILLFAPQEQQPQESWELLQTWSSPGPPLDGPNRVFSPPALDRVWRLPHPLWPCCSPPSWNQESASAWLHPGCGKGVSKPSGCPLGELCTLGLWWGRQGMLNPTSPRLRPRLFQVADVFGLAAAPSLLILTSDSPTAPQITQTTSSQPAQ